MKIWPVLMLVVGNVTVNVPFARIVLSAANSTVGASSGLRLQVARFRCCHVCTLTGASASAVSQLQLLKSDIYIAAVRCNVEPVVKIGPRGRYKKGAAPQIRPMK
jgi:hypothetical protein